MKLTLDMMQSNVSVESQLVSGSVSVTGTRAMQTWLKESFLVSTSLVKSLITQFISKSVLASNHKIESIEKTGGNEYEYQSRYPSHLWNRHSALLVEAEKLHRQMTISHSQIKSTEEVKSSIKQGHVSLHVSKVKSLPVWASHLDEIGVITKQL